MTSLIDVFMPNDLCARCDEEEPVKEHSLVMDSFYLSDVKQTVKLSFCTARCKEAFVRGAEAVKELPDVGF